MHKLNAGDDLPQLTGETLNHGTINLPGDILRGGYSLILAYRANWWAHCHRQFADFSARMDEIEALGVSVYALSTDTRDEAQQMAEKHNLSFPVMFAMDGPKTAEMLGSYYEERRNIIQPTNFILGPEKKIMSITMSSGPVGRLTPEDVVRIVTFYQKQATAK